MSKTNHEEKIPGRRSTWITLLIIALVAIGYAAVLVIGGQALAGAPFAQQILRARDRIAEIVTFEPARSIPRRALESSGVDIALSPSPIVAARPSPSPSFVPPPPDAPSIVTFDIHYDNTTGVQLTGVAVTSRIPASTSYRSGSASPDASFDGVRLVWNIGTLAPGASGSVSFQVLTTTKGRIRNVAVISSNEAPDSAIESTATLD